MYKTLGFDAVQFHDDDAVARSDNLKPEQIIKQATELKKKNSTNFGLAAEFCSATFVGRQPNDLMAVYFNDPGCRNMQLKEAIKP